MDKIEKTEDPINSDPIYFFQYQNKIIEFSPDILPEIDKCETAEELPEDLKNILDLELMCIFLQPAKI